MKFHVLTLFPDMIRDMTSRSMTGRALAEGLISLDLINIRDYSEDKNKRVDDYPYGGGAGMVIEPEPVYQAAKAALSQAPAGTRVIYLTPQAEVLTQVKVEELAFEEELILLCGHYEGIDERVLEEVVTDYVSIGDYVLSGGEIAAGVLIDAISRFIPGVLHNDESTQFESIQDNLLEYPHYTRPPVWHGKEVPQILLSGDHAKVEEWRYEKAVQRTAERRPDLLERNKKVSVLYYGDTEDIAGRVAFEVSRYAEVLNYNRQKLRKSKKNFTSRDRVIIVTDTMSGLDEVFAKLKGSDTPLVLLQLFGADDTEDVGEGIAFLLEKGFKKEGEFFCSRYAGTALLSKIALKIRDL